MVRGLTSASLGLPDIEAAYLQHASYVNALESLGLNVVVMEADENFPDSVFVEDVALLTPDVGIITNPGAESRRGEIHGITSVLNHHYENVERIHPPGTIEAGDIMMAGTHFYIGLSGRTNKEGARQMINILNRYGMTGSMVPLRHMLHLKTGLSYLEHNNLLVAGEFVDYPGFESFNRIIVPDREAYAANSVWINGSVLVPQGYPETRDKIAVLGYGIIELEVSEYRKLDGGLSCLSLRF
jgi:dimethylargininase